jgi:hypothetical protein
VNLRAAVLTLLVVLAAGALAGCGGGSDDPTASVGGETITVPSDAHGVYGELEAILDQLPYEAWYTRCVIHQVRKNLSPSQAEALSELPEDEREAKALQVISGAGPTCQASSHRPLIDAQASRKELDLLRAGFASSMRSLAESGGAQADQVACVEAAVEKLQQSELIEAIDGSKKAREGILLSILDPCATGK